MSSITVCHALFHTESLIVQDASSSKDHEQKQHYFPSFIQPSTILVQGFRSFSSMVGILSFPPLRVSTAVLCVCELRV